MRESDPQSSPGPGEPDTAPLDRQLVPMACVVIALMSLVNSAGFGFPSTDLLAGISLEHSRLMYGVGLFVAGIVSDRNRSHGALVCAVALVVPFLQLSLSGAAAPATLMWALGYLCFGFFSVFRVLVFTDLAGQVRWPQIACLGLLFGRVGDALGSALCITLADHALALIVTTAALFTCTVILFFVLCQRLYAPTVEGTRVAEAEGAAAEVPVATVAPAAEIPAAEIPVAEGAAASAAVAETQPKPGAEEHFNRFVARHGLTLREREVLREVLALRSNAEIAGALYVSEATVKFHVRNLLKKTGCKNRRELIDLYSVGGDSPAA